MLGRLLTKLFALFGITLTAVACYGTPYSEYDPTLESEFVASGYVVDEAGKAICNIRVRLGSTEMYTSESGYFCVNSANDNMVEFTDIDGGENGGEFEPYTAMLLEQGWTNMRDIVLKRADDSADEQPSEQ